MHEREGPEGEGAHYQIINYDRLRSAEIQATEAAQHGTGNVGAADPIVFWRSWQKRGVGLGGGGGGEAVGRGGGRKLAND